MKQLFFTLLLITQLSFAQNSETNSSTPKERKIALGISFSPDYSYRSITVINTNNTSSKILKELFDSYEIPMYAYTTGIKLSTILKKRFTYETGILFSKKGYKTKVDTLVSYVYDPNAPQTASYRYNYYSFDIPLKVNFYPIKTKTGGFSVSTGLIANLFFKRVDINIYGFSNKPTLENKYVSNNFELTPSVFVSLGYQQQLSNRLFFKAEPIYRRNLS